MNRIMLLFVGLALSLVLLFLIPDSGEVKILGVAGLVVFAAISALAFRSIETGMLNRIAMVCVVIAIVILVNRLYLMSSILTKLDVSGSTTITSECVVNSSMPGADVIKMALYCNMANAFSMILLGASLGPLIAAIAKRVGGYREAEGAGR